MADVPSNAINARRFMVASSSVSATTIPKRAGLRASRARGTAAKCSDMLRESIDSFLLCAFAGQMIQLALLANLFRGDCRHPILIGGSRQPVHLVPAVR